MLLFQVAGLEGVKVKRKKETTKSTISETGPCIKSEVSVAQCLESKQEASFKNTSKTTEGNRKKSCTEEASEINAEVKQESGLKTTTEIVAEAKQEIKAEEKEPSTISKGNNPLFELVRYSDSDSGSE